MLTSSISSLKNNFMEQLRDPKMIQDLFYHFPDINIVIKNLKSQFILGTNAWLDMVDVKHNDEIVGKTDLDFFPEQLAQLYIEEDQAVFRGENYRNRDWLVPQSPGFIASCKVSKFAIYDKNDRVCGLICQLDHWRQTLGESQTFTEMGKVADHIEKNYKKDIAIEDLAKLAHLSESQFHRNFKKIYKTSPLNYITKIRLNSACYELRTSKNSVFNIAIEHGYYDSSHFSKVFKQYLGQSPAMYRKTTKNMTEK